MLLARRTGTCMTTNSLACGRYYCTASKGTLPTIDSASSLSGFGITVQEMTPAENRMQRIMANAGALVVTGCVAAELAYNPDLACWNPLQQGLALTVGLGAGAIAGTLCGPTVPVVFGGLLTAVSAQAVHFELVQRPLRIEEKRVRVAEHKRIHGSNR